MSTDFAQLNARYRSRLQAHCRRLLGSSEDAEDAVQETLLRAWRWRESRRPGASTPAWLYRIATNVCFDAIDRRRRQRRAIEALQADADALTFDPAPEDKETVELAYLAAIQLLPPRQRSVLILREVLGRSARETAELLDSSVASVNSAGQRARATLREHLPRQRLEWAAGAEPSAEQRELLRRYLEATERGDAEAVVGALCERQPAGCQPGGISSYCGASSPIWCQLAL